NNAQIHHPVHRHDAFELMLDLLQHMRCAARHDRYAGKMPLMLGLGDCEAVDIVAPPGEEPDYPRQHPRLVVDQNRKRVAFRLLCLLGDEIGRTGGLKMGGHLHSCICIMPMALEPDDSECFALYCE